MPHSTTLSLERIALACALALSLLAVVPAACSALWDVDVWWILRAGDDLRIEGHVPTHNRYAFTVPTFPWIMHEWGFGALYSALRARFGIASLAWVRIAAVGVVAWACAWRTLRDARGWLAAVVVATTLATFGVRFESPRPVGIAYVWAVCVACIAFEARFTWRHAGASALLMFAWTNTHGSFPRGLASLALATLEPGGDRRIRIAAVVLASAASIVNPYGLSLHGLAFRYALGDGGDAVAVTRARVTARRDGHQ